MSGISIPQKDWKSFLKRFSERHAGWLVQLEAHGRKTDESVASEVSALQSIELDLEDKNNPRINVIMVSNKKEIKHILFRPSQVVLHMSEQNGEDALQITSLNIDSTIRFRGAKVMNVLDALDRAA